MIKNSDSKVLLFLTGTIVNIDLHYIGGYDNIFLFSLVGLAHNYPLSCSSVS